MKRGSDGVFAAYDQLQSVAKTGGEMREGKAEIKGEGKTVCNCSRMMI